MPTMMLELDEATGRRLEELVALDGVETAPELVARLLPRWLEEYKRLWDFVEVGRKDAREGRASDGEAFFDALEADLQSEIAARERIAAE